MKFEYVTYIEATPEKVWHALTDADLSAEYWGHIETGHALPQAPWEMPR